MFKRSLCLSMAIVTLTGVAVAQSVLVNTRHDTFERVSPETPLLLNLKDYFQRFESPGPIVTFTYDRPVYDEDRLVYAPLRDNDGNWIGENEDGTFDENTPSATIATFQTTSGEKYLNIYESTTDQFVWEENLTLTVQLRPDEAPVTVANFLAYVQDKDYDYTVVHRSEIGVIQTGGWKADPLSSYVWDTIEPRTFIPLEQGQSNPKGSIAMARGDSADSASNQFFFNLRDNSAGFGNRFAVFGNLIEEDMDKLTALDQPYSWNMGSIFRSIAGSVQTVPLWTSPYEYADKNSYLRFKSVTVNQGNTEGIQYEWEWDEENTEEEQKATFDISLDSNTGVLTIERLGAGQARIFLKATYNDTTLTTFVNLSGIDLRLNNYFGNLSVELPDDYTSNRFGDFSYEEYPFINSDDWGQIGLGRLVEGSAARYFKDMATDLIFYTTSTLYPTVYIFEQTLGEKTISGWYEFSPEASSAENRFFYDYAEEQWVDDSFTPIAE